MDFNFHFDHKDFKELNEGVRTNTSLTTKCFNKQTLEIMTKMFSPKQEVIWKLELPKALKNKKFWYPHHKNL
jgi:hypothetical protein